MRYPTVLFDLDHTLFDSDASLRAAFSATLSAFDVPEPETYRSAFSMLNDALWKQVETGVLTPPQVHTARFVQLAGLIDLPLDPAALADRYSHELGDQGDLYPGARELLDRLCECATLALVTNGLSEVQRARLRRLDIDHYFSAVVISAEVATAKPGQAIFDLTFEQLGNPDRATALMVGDSLTSDIAGGAASGLPTCWYNPTGQPHSGSIVPTHTVATMSGIGDVVIGGARTSDEISPRAPLL